MFLRSGYPSRISADPLTFLPANEPASHLDVTGNFVESNNRRASITFFILGRISPLESPRLSVDRPARTMKTPDEIPGDGVAHSASISRARASRYPARRLESS